VTAMAALTAGVDRPGVTADLGPGGRPAARTTGPAAEDRSAAVSSGARTVRSWPLLVLAAPAAADAEISRYLAAYRGYFGKEAPHGAVRKGPLAGKYPGTGPSGRPQNVR